MFTFLEYSEEVARSYALSQAEFKKWSTSLMVVGTMAGFTPAGSMILRRGGDGEVATGDTHLKS